MSSGHGCYLHVYVITFVVMYLTSAHTLETNKVKLRKDGDVGGIDKRSLSWLTRLPPLLNWRRARSYRIKSNKIGSEFLGKRSTVDGQMRQLLDYFDKQRISESDEKRMGSEFVGKRLGSEFVGKRPDDKRIGSEFVGKRDRQRKIGTDFKRIGSEFVGKRIGSEFVGKRIGSEFVGKRTHRPTNSETDDMMEFMAVSDGRLPVEWKEDGRNFKWKSEVAINYQDSDDLETEYKDVNKRLSEFLGGPGKRLSEFLGGPGKRVSEFLGGPGKRMVVDDEDYVSSLYIPNNSGRIKRYYGEPGGSEFLGGPGRKRKRSYVLFPEFEDKNQEYFYGPSKRLSEFLGGPGKRTSLYSFDANYQKRLSEFLGGPGKRSSKYLGGPRKRLSEFLGGPGRR